MVKKEEKQLSVTVKEAKAEKKPTSEDSFADFDFSKLKIDLETMLKSGVHFGHQKSRKNPKMDPYIYITRKGISIIDLERTLEKLEEALDFIKELKSSGKQMLFVGTKKQIKDLVKEAAQKCKMSHVTERWLGGTFTNFKVIRSRAKYLKESQEKMERGEFKMYTKLERMKKMEEQEDLERKMGGIKDMSEFPGAVLVVDTKEDNLAVKEAKKVGIPIIGVVDTNCDPSEVDYPIPANDDAVSSVRLILGYICKTLVE